MPMFTSFHDNPFYKGIWLCLALFCSSGPLKLWGQVACLNFEDCLNYAYEHSPMIQRNVLALEQASLNQKQADWSRYPSVSGSARYGLNVGRSVDLTSYQFVNQAMQAVNLSVNANVPLYNGLQLRNNLKQRRVEYAATEQDLAQAKQDLAMNLAQSYLSFLLAEANLRIAREQVVLTQAQLNQTLRLIEAGNLADNVRYDLEAQIARDEQNIINAENSLALADLSLKQLLNWPENQELKLCELDVKLPESPELPETWEGLYREASGAWPALRAAQLREQAAKWGIRIAKGALEPNVALFSSLATNYSSLGQRYSGDSMTINQVFAGELNGLPFVLRVPTSIPGRERSPFFAQIKDNFTQAVGVSVQVPIYNGGQARLNVQRAELNLRLAELNTEQTQLQLKNQLAQAWTAVKASVRSLEAAQRSLKATELAAQNSQKRFEQGLINVFEWTSVQNNLSLAKINFENAKYDYLFRLQILRYYQVRD